MSHFLGMDNRFTKHKIAEDSMYFWNKAQRPYAANDWNDHSKKISLHGFREHSEASKGKNVKDCPMKYNTNELLQCSTS